MSSFANLIYWMTREDFVLFEKKKQEVFQKTKEEQEAEHKALIAKKETIALPIIKELWVEVSSELIDANSRYEIYKKLFETNRNKYKELLGDKKIQANLDERAEYFANQDNKYETFLDFIIKNEWNVLDIVNNL